MSPLSTNVSPLSGQKCIAKSVTGSCDLSHRVMVYLESSAMVLFRQVMAVTKSSSQAPSFRLKAERQCLIEQLSIICKFGESR